MSARKARVTREEAVIFDMIFLSQEAVVSLLMHWNMNYVVNPVRSSSVGDDDVFRCLCAASL